MVSCSWELVTDIEGLPAGSPDLIDMSKVGRFSRYPMGNRATEELERLISGEIVQARLVVDREDGMSDEDFAHKCTNLIQNLHSRAAAQNTRIVGITRPADGNPNMRYVYYQLKEGA